MLAVQQYIDLNNIGQRSEWSYSIRTGSISVQRDDGEDGREERKEEADSSAVERIDKYTLFCAT